MACKRVRDIKPREKASTIEIRVLKKWISIGKKKELCYLFVDSHGDAIEATADVNKQEYFDSMILLYSCYKVSKYICVDKRTYMATVNHPASLIIGAKATFVPLPNCNIPTVFFSFAAYGDLKSRIKDTSRLTDYIGRVERNSLRETSTKKILRKVLLQDEWQKPVEITLWPEKAHLIDDKIPPGAIIAITSTTVSEYNGLIQLESTFLTNVTINPDLPQTMKHVKRLQALPPMETSNTIASQVTISELLSKTRMNNQGQQQFTCNAKIKAIYTHRSWYYVICSKCPNKLYPEEDGSLNFVCKDDDDIVPNFLYNVNATIYDTTGAIDVVFFNEGMSAMLNTSCEDMVRKQGYIDAKKLPEPLASKIDVPYLLHLTVKNDGKVIVNNVSKPAATSDAQPSNTQTAASTLPPSTPNPRHTNSKRQHFESPDATQEAKKHKS